MRRVYLPLMTALKYFMFLTSSKVGMWVGPTFSNTSARKRWNT